MKILVAAACVAIIAFVGFFFWDRYAAAQAAAYEQSRSYCRQIAADADRILATKDMAAGLHPYETVNRDFSRCIENPTLQPGE